TGVNSLTASGEREKNRRAVGGRRVVGGLHSFGRFLQGPAAARTLGSGAAVTGARDPCGAAVEIVRQQIFEPAARAVRSAQRHMEQLVEVAVIEIAAPVDRYEVAAHDTVQVFVAMSLAQQTHVTVEFALGDQGRAEALDRHVGKREQTIEYDAELVSKLAPV